MEWWQDREEGWDLDAVLDEWDSAQTSDGYAEVHKTVFFPEGVDERPLDPEERLLVWDRHVLLRDLRGAVHQVPLQLDADYRQFAAWCAEQPEHVIFIAGATVLVRNVTLRDHGVAPGMLLEMRARLTGGGWRLTPASGAGRLPCAEVRDLEGVFGGVAGDSRGTDTCHREDDRQVCRQLAFSVDGRQRQLPGAGTGAYVDVAGMFRNVCRCPVGLLRDEICAGSPRGVSRP